MQFVFQNVCDDNGLDGSKGTGNEAEKSKETTECWQVK
jgi:hypothetical protein